jgi:hypothetical protein
MPHRRKKLGILYRGIKIEANSRNSVPNLLRKRTNSEFRSVEQKKKQTLGIPFRSISRTKTHCQFCLLMQDFLYNQFFSCCSVPSFGIDSSKKLGMPLPLNNGNHSESIPQNFFGTEIPLPTLLLTNESLRTREGEGKPLQINANDCALKASWAFQLQVANERSSYDSTGHYFCMETYCDSTVTMAWNFILGFKLIRM